MERTYIKLTEYVYNHGLTRKELSPTNLPQLVSHSIYALVVLRDFEVLKYLHRLSCFFYDETTGGSVWSTIIESLYCDSSQIDPL